MNLGCELVHRSKQTGDVVAAYSVIREIGRGGFGIVYKAEMTHPREHNGTIVAIKVVDTQRLDENRIQNEISALRELEHKNILHIYGWWSEGTHYFIATEYCARGDLKEILRSRGGKPFEEPEVRRIASDIVEGLSYVHDKGIIHRDISISNIFMTKDGVCKIGDFGLAASEMPVKGSTSTPNTCMTVCGTPNSMAPEVFKPKKHTKMVDLWGLGVILYQLLHGRPPFDDGKVSSTKQRIQTTNPKMDSKLSPNAVHLINGLLQKNERERLTLDRVREHPFLKESPSFYDSGIGTTGLTRTSYSQNTDVRKAPELRQPILAGISEMDLQSRYRNLGRGYSLTSPSMPDMFNGDYRPSSRAFVRSNSVDRFPAPLTPPTRDQEFRTESRVPDNLCEKINTARLSSTNWQEVKTGAKGRITETGDVQFRFDILMKNKGRIFETVTVSSDGDRVIVHREGEFDPSRSQTLHTHRYALLPPKYYQKYQLMAKFVQSMRARTPKFTEYTDKYVVKLMENQPEADFEVTFYAATNVVITYKASQRRIEYKTNHGVDKLPANTLSEQDFRSRPFLRKFIDLHSESKNFVELLEKQSRSFPAIFGKPPDSHPSKIVTTSMMTEPIYSSTFSNARLISTSTELLSSSKMQEIY